MHISNVVVSYDVCLIKHAVEDAMKLREKVKKRNAQFLLCTTLAVIATIVCFIICTGNVESACVLGILVAMLLGGCYSTFYMWRDVLSTDVATTVYREIMHADHDDVQKLEEIQELNDTQYLKAFLNTDIADSVLDNTELAVAALSGEPIYIEPDFSNPEDVTLVVTTGFRSITLDVDVCHFNVSRYNGDGSDLVVFITDDELILRKGDIELKPVNVKVE